MGNYLDILLCLPPQREIWVWVILCFILDREMNVGRTELQFVWIFDNIV